MQPPQLAKRRFRASATESKEHFRYRKTLKSWNAPLGLATTSAQLMESDLSGARLLPGLRSFYERHVHRALESSASAQRWTDANAT